MQSNHEETPILTKRDMEAADRCWRAYETGPYSAEGGKGVREHIAEAIAEERAKERERCAKIAEHAADWSDVGDSTTAYEIAKKIRTSD